MPLGSTFNITYGGFTVGGSGGYQLHNPYVIDKSFTALRLTFSVMVTAASTSALKSASDSLEDAFRKRDQNLTISMGGSSWTYTFGSNILNTTATAIKSGDPQSDRGFSRLYNCTIIGELPADDQAGLRDLQVSVRYEAGRQLYVGMNGTYTALSGTDASQKYQNEFDSEAQTILTGIDGGATFELVAEDYNHDRTNHLCQFSRQYVQLIYDQSKGTRDDTDIVASQVVFTVLSSYPGDGQEGINRLHRVQASYSGYADIEENDDLHDIVDTKCKDFLKSEFEDEFKPKVFAVEDMRIQYDESSKRFNVQMTFVFQTQNGTNIVEISVKRGITEQRQIDYTYVHDGDELTAYADPGFLTLERMTSRVVVAIGEEEPRRRLSADDDGKGGAGGVPGMDIEAPREVQQSGWNRISNSSQVSPQWIGDPEEGDEQIRVTVLTEEVLERFNKAPQNRPATGPVTTPGYQPIAPGGDTTPSSRPGGAITPGSRPIVR